MALKPIEILIRAKDEASSVFGGMQSKLAAVGAAIAGYFGIKAFAGAVQGAADLESKLSEVKAVSGATADQMVRLRQAAEEAGANTQYTATEAADALGNLARAGLTAQQAIDALPATLQLAQAGGVGLAKASEFVTKAVNGMGLSFNDAGRVADVLAMGANASNTSVTGLADALSYAAPTAHSLGLSLESTVAIIGKFADAGIDASRAGTALNGILAQFSDPASTFKKALSDIGITTTNFNAALTQLAAAGPRGQKAIAAVGLEAGPALKALLGQGIGALDDLRTKLQNAQGSAAATAATMSDNLNGSIKGLGSAWDTLKNALATPVLPVLKAGVESLAASFRDAVSSGVVAKFGAAIATGFESAIVWAKAFAAQVDFAALGEQMRGYAAQASEAFDNIKNAATTAGDVVRLVWGTMSAGTNTVLMAVYYVGGVFTTMVAQIQTSLALLNDGFSKVTFGKLAADFAASANAMRLSADATNAAAAALERKAIDAFNAMADGAQTARTGWTGLTTDSNTTANAMAGTVSPALAKTAADLQAMGDKATEAGSKATKSAEAQAKASADAKAKVVELRAEYEAAVRSGDWKAQIQVMQQLEQATNLASVAARALNKENDAAKKAADAVAAAFEGMGIKTKDELQKLADTAKTRFDLIKTSGKATADGVATAWETMAEAAIAANGGVATETLKVQAGMYKLRIETDATGKSLVKAMDTSPVKAMIGAIQQTSDAVELLNTKYKLTSQYTERQIDLLLKQVAAQEKVNELKEREKALIDAHYKRDKEGFSLNTAGQRIQEDVQTRRTVYDNAKGQGLDEKAALAIANQFISESGAKVGWGGANTARGETWGTELQKAIDKQVLGNANRSAASTAAIPGAAATPAKTYNVQIGGSTAKFDSDAEAQGFMAALKNAKLSS